MAIRQAKDNSFKLIMDNHQLFVDFIPIDILKSIKPEDIEDLCERFLPPNQNARDSDTVKRLNLNHKDIPLLFVIAIVEHESKVNFRTSFKMLLYIGLVLDKYEKGLDDPGGNRPMLPIPKTSATPR